MAKEKMSDRQAKILDYIRKFIATRNYSPSVRDIQEGLSISSTSVVDYNLKGLEERGLIQRDKGISRAIKLIEAETRAKAPAEFRIPMALTPIAAGSPIPVMQDVLTATDGIDTIDVSEALLGRHVAHVDQLYALKVKGRSMIDAFINDGDIVIILSQNTATVGQTVVAWLREEQEATLKKYYPETQGRIRLQPANETMDPIYTTAENLEIKGRVVGVLRTVD